MGIASMVIGIVSLVCSFIPCVGFFTLIPILVGFILGIVDTVLKGKAKQPRGMSIAGIVLNAIALASIVLQFLAIGAVLSAPAMGM